METSEKTNQWQERSLEPQDLSKIDHERAQLHQVTPEEDARIRRKVDLVVLPMV